MTITDKALGILKEINAPNTKLGDLRKIARSIKKDHELALQLWSAGNFNPRQLAILIMDKKLLDQDTIDRLVTDMNSHDYDERNQLADWLMANQLTKDKNATQLIESWERHPFALLRRIFWYYQARLRWMGKIPINNAEQLLDNIESNIENEAPEVQWAMNFTAGQIGIYEPDKRQRCIAIGKKTGLFRDEIVSRGCTPNYLPEFIRIQVSKLNN